MSMQSTLPVAVIGAGPVGLAAAAHLLHQRAGQHSLDIAEAGGELTPSGQ